MKDKSVISNQSFCMTQVCFSQFKSHLSWTGNAHLVKGNDKGGVGVNFRVGGGGGYGCFSNDISGGGERVGDADGYGGLWFWE